MSQITKEILLVKHGSPCPYCSRLMNVHSEKLKPTKDHVKPRSRFKGSQILIVCAECNGTKGNRTIEEFFDFLVCRNEELRHSIVVNNLRLEMLESLILEQSWT